MRIRPAAVLLLQSIHQQEALHAQPVAALALIAEVQVAVPVAAEASAVEAAVEVAVPVVAAAAAEAGDNGESG